MKSKTIILSKENEKGRGILTIFQENDILECRLRLYNINSLSRYCKIGIYHQNEVFSANLLLKNGAYTSSLVGNFDIDQDFYTAIIDTQNNNQVIISGGTYSGFFFNNNVFEDNLNTEILNENTTERHEEELFQDIEKENPNTNIYKYNEDLKSPIKNEDFCNTNDCQNNKNDEYERCKNCKYKEFFFANSNTTINEELETANNQNVKTLLNEKLLTENVETNKALNEENLNHKQMLNSLIPQFKNVFENYPKDEILINLIPNSKFVKINENKDQFSIGAIYNEGEIKYICYATFCTYNSPAPQELGEHYQWLPLDNEDPLSDGYYIVFQDASDFKIVEL